MLYGEVLDPLTLPEHTGTQGAFDQLQGLANDKEGNDAQTGETAQQEGHGDAAAPYKTAVEQEGDQGLTAGTEGKVGGVGVGIEGHHYGVDADQHRGQRPDILGGVIDSGEEAGAEKSIVRINYVYHI